MGYSVIILMCMFLMFPSYSQADSVPGVCDYLIRAHVSIVSWPPIPPPPPHELVYDDGTAYWLTWGGLYRGSCFDPDEFCGGPMLGCIVESMEFWFYHHPDYPWDTSEFYAELWLGGTSAPLCEYDKTQLTATHYSPVSIIYTPSFELSEPFWGFVNLEMSAGGWPSLLGDNSPNFTGEARSFMSDDFIIWEPWIGGEASANLMDLENNSWGSIKGLFR